jgi:branched-chain amino acid transport system ATP-binding protein
MENVRLAAQSRTTKRISIFRNANKLRDIEEKARYILEEVGLTKVAYQNAGSVSYGYQRFLEVGIALATDPVLMLLDEPTSGLPPDEAFRLANLIKNISKGLTILLVEHHMKVVMSISDMISVLQQGIVIAEGPPKEIQENDLVKRAYLGGI